MMNGLIRDAISLLGRIKIPEAGALGWPNEPILVLLGIRTTLMLTIIYGHDIHKTWSHDAICGLSHGNRGKCPSEPLCRRGWCIMKKWKISEAKARFTELMNVSREEPQIICNRENPVGAVIDIHLFEELMALRASHQLPTISDLLSELGEIQQIEPSEIDLPPRKDRTTPFEDSDDEMAL